jgi:alpha-mannosidase
VVDVAARVLWYERSARMKLVLDWPGEAEYEVPGGSVARGNVGEVPALRWVRVRGARGVLGFASDVLYGFDCTGKGLGVSVVRATRYGTDASEEAGEAPWHPVGDAGELRFRFLISEGGRQLERLAAELDRPPVTLPVPAHPGPLGREGSFGELSGAGLRLLRLERGEDGQVRAWVQGVGGATGGSLSWLGRRYRIAPLPRGRIRCINLAGARPVRQRL